MALNRDQILSQNYFDRAWIDGATVITSMTSHTQTTLASFHPEETVEYFTNSLLADLKTSTDL
jgi:hypothetical protein